VAAYAQMAGVGIILGRNREIIEWADRAFELAGRIGCDVPARTLGFRGYARAALGDPGGIADMREAILQAIQRGEARDAAVLYNNLAVAVLPIEGPGSTLAILEEGIEFAERRGVAEMAQAMKVASLDVLVEQGQWDRAIQLAEAIEPVAVESGAGADLIQSRWVIARVSTARGDFERAVALAEWLVDAARQSESSEDLLGAFPPAAAAFLGIGQRERAAALLFEVEATPHVRETPAYSSALPSMVRTAVAAGDPSLAERLAHGVRTPHPYFDLAAMAARATLAEARGDVAEASKLYQQVAGRCERFGVVPERAYALLGAGRCLLRLQDRGAEADLRNARELFATLGVRHLIAELDELLGAQRP
jgi:tetratricopeptide (TPR) repeat protein